MSQTPVQSEALGALRLQHAVQAAGHDAVSPCRHDVPGRPRHACHQFGQTERSQVAGGATRHDASELHAHGHGMRVHRIQMGFARQAEGQFGCAQAAVRVVSECDEQPFQGRFRRGVGGHRLPALSGRAA
mgnify:CR=1 FL=1